MILKALQGLRALKLLLSMAARPVQCNHHYNKKATNAVSYCCKLTIIASEFRRPLASQISKNFDAGTNGVASTGFSFLGPHLIRTQFGIPTGSKIFLEQVLRKPIIFEWISERKRSFRFSGSFFDQTGTVPQIVIVSKPRLFLITPE